MPDDAQHDERFSRQTRFVPLGMDGQRMLEAARVAIVGCGALGGAAATALTRAGVRRLRLIDRDVAERSNLPRQLLLDEEDVDAEVPKAVAAAEHLRRVDHSATIEPVVRDLTAASCERLLSDVDLVIDGTDNFEARFLINEFSCRHGVPWIYGGAIGGEGRVLTVVPGRTACFRCLVPDPPAPGDLPTCQSAGILGPAAMVVGAVQAAEAIKLLSAANDEQRASRTSGRMLVFDLWTFRWQAVDLSSLAAGCPTCREGDTPWLDGRLGSGTVQLCGQDAVQIDAPAETSVDLVAMAARLSPLGSVSTSRWTVRAEVEPGISLTIFADGRVIIRGTRDESVARGILAKYVGQ